MYYQKRKEKIILTLISIWLKINIRKSSNMIICMFSRKNGILTSTYNCVCGIDILCHCNFTKYVFMRCTISRTKQTSRMLFLVHCKWLHMLHRENQRQSKIGKESLNVKICIYIFWQIANLPFKKLPFYQELYIFCSVVVSKFISYLKFLWLMGVLRWYCPVIVSRVSSSNHSKWMSN